MKKKLLVLAFCISTAMLTLFVTSPRSELINPKTLSGIDITGNKTLVGHYALKDSRISPGNSPGKITVTGDFSFGSNAVYLAEIKDLSGPGFGHDQIDVSGNLVLDGTLDIILDGYTPDNSGYFEILAFGGTISGTFSSINWPASMSSWSIDYGTIVPNRVVIHGPEGVLPIILVDFTVKSEGNQHVLSWQTATEFNNDYFIIEHGASPQKFHELQRINSLGNSLTMQYYTCMNSSLLKGDNYYRLKQVDQNGKFSYSNIISLWDAEGNIFDFFPNPSKEILRFNQEVESIVIYDILGSEIFSAKNVGMQLDVTHLPSGIYHLKINSAPIQQRLVIGY